MLRRDDQQLIAKAEEIARLLFKEMNHELTASERQTLNEWLDQQSSSTQEFFGDVTARAQLDKDLYDFESINVTKALKEVQDKIALIQEHPEAEIEAFHSRRKKSRLAPAAMLVILLAGVFAWVYIQSRGKATMDNMSEPQYFHNDVAPGGDKAVLTLADGSQITLDKAANGQLARQGATKVMKLDAGKLAYNAGASKEQAPEKIEYNTISTPRGGQYQVLLPDGSRVWLNSASSLRFPTVFAGKGRRVELSGEAYFDISPNKSLPFKVSIAHPSHSYSGGGAGAYSPLEIEVLGTAFDVEAYAEEGDQRTTLISGAVKVTKGNEPAFLKPGQQARSANNSGLKMDVVPVNTEEVSAWKDGTFLFESASIQTIMRQLARWYDVDVKYEGKVPVQRLTANVSRNNNLSDILRVLEISGYHFDIRGNTIVVKN